MTVTPVSAPAFLRLSQLSEGNEQVRRRLVAQLDYFKAVNVRQESYYEGSRAVRDLGIAIPPSLRDVPAVAAWPEIVVDVIDERMTWRGWYTRGADFGLAETFDANHLGVELGQATLDSLICGISFLTVGTGEVGEPEVLVKAESPSRMTATWSPRLRRISEALVELFDDEGHLSGWRLYLPGVTITTEVRNNALVVADMDEHGLPRVPVAAMMNRPRGNRPMGRSEITRAVRSFTDSGMRTLLGMEVSREFYAAPQRYLMGADESMFVDSEGNPKSQWAAIIGHMLMAPRDENDELPVPGQFQAASPQPFSDLLRTYSQMISAATGIPAHHLGFTTDNPASEGAIRRADARLDKRAENRIKQFDVGLIEAGELVVLWRDGELPPAGAVKSLWEDVTTPTPGAAADRAAKMLDAGVITADMDFTLEQYGLSDDEIARVRQERRRSGGSAALRAITDAAAAGRPVVSTAPVADADDASA